MKTNTFTFKGKEVEYTRKYDNAFTWSYDGIESEKIRELNQTLHEDITVEIISKINNEIIAEEEERKKMADAEEKARIEFEVKIKDMLDPTYEVIAENPMGCAIIKSGHRMRIEYNDTVFPKSGLGRYRGEKTDRPWEVSGAGMRSTRYSTLEKAAASVAKKIEELIDRYLQKVRDTAKKEEHAQYLESEVSKTGLIFQKRTQSYHNGRRFEYYDSYAVSVKASKDAVVSATLIEIDSKVMVSNISITGVYTPEQMKAIAEFVSSLK